MENTDTSLYISAIEEILAEARTWTANDGGLTMSGMDMVAMAKGAIAKILAGEPTGYISSDRWSTSTGLEGELIDICLDIDGYPEV